MAHITDQKHLQNFIEGVNLWAKVIKTKVYDHKKLTAEDRRELLDRLDSEQSPENLCCDGELSGNTLKLKAAKLAGARRALEATK